MDARKADMRKLLLELRQYAESRYNVTNEVAIYDKLLGFEESRISTHSQRRSVTVSSRTSKRSKSVASASGSVSSMASSPVMETSGYSTTRESYGSMHGGSIVRESRSSAVRSVRSSSSTINGNGEKDGFLSGL